MFSFTICSPKEVGIDWHWNKGQNSAVNYFRKIFYHRCFAECSLIKRQNYHHTETSQLIYTVNHLIGFYMMATLAFNKLNTPVTCYLEHKLAFLVILCILLYVLAVWEAKQAAIRQCQKQIVKYFVRRKSSVKKLQ